MSVWLTIPSARPDGGSARAWKAAGYNVALWRDPGSAQLEYGVCDLWRVDNYSGYASACNALIHDVMEQDPQCEWCVCAGDDVLPDQDHEPEEISRQCREHFSVAKFIEGGPTDWGMVSRTETFGVMQPTGDRWGEDPRNHNPAMRSAYIDRVAGSAWVGREFIRRAYMGKGPLWPEYTHMGVDEELREVAVKLGVYWERPDLNQHHDHWGRAKAGENMAPRTRMPAFLEKANSPQEWDRYKFLLAKRKQRGFPGSELLP